jgi:hypothetical protein
MFRLSPPKLESWLIAGSDDSAWNRWLSAIQDVVQGLPQDLHLLRRQLTEDPKLRPTGDIFNLSHRPQLVHIVEPTPKPTPDTRPIWPGRIELIYKQYLVEKEAWLTTHLTVRPCNYRQKRGLESYSPRWCKEQSRYHAIFQITISILKQRLSLRVGHTRLLRRSTPG